MPTPEQPFASDQTFASELPSAPQLRLVLAISLDGRLAAPEGGAAQIGGRGDRRVLEEALAWADGALIGAETLRRHGSTCLIHAADLLQERDRQGRPRQPDALVVSRSGTIPAGLPFFSQPLRRWLLLASAGRPAGDAGAAPPFSGPEAAAAQACQGPPGPPAGFDRQLPCGPWRLLLPRLAAAGMQRLVVLGGAALATSLLADDCLDELQLTLCPRLLGGPHGWLQGGVALPPGAGQGWRLLELRPLEGEELLLRYGRARQPLEPGAELRPA